MMENLQQRTSTTTKALLKQLVFKGIIGFTRYRQTLIPLQEDERGLSSTHVRFAKADYWTAFIPQVSPPAGHSHNSYQQPTLTTPKKNSSVREPFEFQRTGSVLRI